MLSNEESRFLAATAFLRNVGWQHAQLYQDLWVLYERARLGLPLVGGFFVEFGACNGVLLSNTLLLERAYAWRGICAEALPWSCRALRRQRHCAVDPRPVWSKSGERLRFMVAQNPELSGALDTLAADGNAEVRRAGSTIVELPEPSVSLHDLLTHHEAPRTIDYLSVDTEGSEYAILSAFDWDKWDVRMLSVEHNFTTARDRLHGLLSGLGFVRRFVGLSKWDSWYIKDAAA